MSGRSGGWIRPGGLVVALVGFGVTRLFVAESVRVDAAVPYLLSGLVPLTVGLGLTAYGVILAVGAFPREYVSVVARWCLLGTAGMLVVLLVASGETLAGAGQFGALSESPVLVANVLLGGAVGGVLVGSRSATNRRQRRELRRRANQALLVNRLLRHEVINAAAIADGHATQIAESATDRLESVEAIRESADDIVETVEEIGDIIAENEGGEEVDVAEVLGGEIDAVRSSAPDRTLRYDRPDGAVTVADAHRLGMAFRQLLQYAVGERSASDVRIDLAAGNDEVVIAVADDGRPLSADERDLLTTGEFPEYDDPTTGFRLQIARLLIARNGGVVAVATGEDAGTDEDATTEGAATLVEDAAPLLGDGSSAVVGDGSNDGRGGSTEITVTIPRNDGDVATVVEVAAPDVLRAVVAGLGAGVAMGAYFAATSDTMPVIGALYGVEHPVVGWVTHLFHSVVFAVLFAAGAATGGATAVGAGSVAGSPESGAGGTSERDRAGQGRSSGLAGRPLRSALAGIGWGAVLWLVAAGVVMPLWLQVVGVPAALPNLSRLGLVSHLLWGGVLGVSYALLGTHWQPEVELR